MKRISFCLLILLMPAVLSAALPEPTIMSDSDCLMTDLVAIDSQMIDKAVKWNYRQTKNWRHYKTQKICAWSCLGVGTVGVFYGLIFTELGSFYNEDGSVGWPGPTLLAFGGAAILSSIPLFIFSNKNKKKAEALPYLTIKLKPLGVKMAYDDYTVLPSLTFSVNF